jgi:hypothetical protein
MMDFKPGDVFFLIHSKNDISKAIAAFTGSKWSHAGMIMEKGDFATYTIETCDFNVWTNHFEKYLRDPYCLMEVYRPKMDSLDIGAVVRAAQATHGQTYGYFQFISLGIRGLLRVAGFLGLAKWLPNFIRQGIVCNQVVLTGYQYSGIPGLQGIDPESIDHEETYQLVKNSDRFELVFEKGVL